MADLRPTEFQSAQTVPIPSSEAQFIPRSICGSRSTTMIITRTPFRLTLGGGGTDLPSFYREHGGFIFAVGLDKYMYLNVKLPILEETIRVQYSKLEIVEHVDELQHTLAREVLKFLRIQSGIEIVSIADVPSGTGLGSSSCYLVGLLNALHCLGQAQLNPWQLAEEACDIELVRLQK